MKANRRTSELLLIAGAILLTITAAIGVHRLRKQADESRTMEILLGRIETQINRLQGLQWQAAAQGHVSSEFLIKLQSARMSMLQAARDLKQHEPSGEILAPFYTAYTEYVRAVDQEVLLIAVGRYAEASKLDFELASPNHKVLTDAIELANLAFNQLARESQRKAEIQSVAVIAVPTIAVFILFWRFENARRVTQLVVAEQSVLRRSEERYRSLTENAFDIVAILDCEGSISYLSGSVERVLGHEQSASDGKNFFDFVHPEELSLARCWIADVVQATGKPLPLELRLRHARNEWIYTEAIGRSLLNDPNIQGVVVNCRDISARKDAEDRLIHNAFHDVLTNLPNRALFLDRLRRAFNYAKRHPDYQFAVLFIDIDNFKIVNDSLGHACGDQLINAIAARLADALRRDEGASRSTTRVGPDRPPGDDTLARFGGDEFTVLLDDIKDPRNGLRVAERIREALATPFSLGSQEVFVTASIGIAMSDTPHSNADDLLRGADTAMYRAKASGKAQCEVFDTKMHVLAVSRLKLETELRRAVERGEFLLTYQPIVSLQDGRIVGFEALLRWQRPEVGLVSPTEFITVAEETALIIPIGQWVLREACEQAQSWNCGRPFPLTISVNISAKQFAQADLATQMEQALRQSGLNPAYLKLEITESLAMSDAEKTGNILSQLKALGVGLSIDDFGTGYSSLSYLRRFPVDTLKIDRSFIHGLGTDNESLEIVRTIVTLAHNLGLDVVGEGTETIDQVNSLRDFGCEFAQGYYFYRPMDQKAVEELFGSQRSQKV